MKASLVITALAVMSMPACTSTSTTPGAGKEAVITQARSIHSFPVSRAALISTLGLGGHPGYRVDGSIRGGWMSFSETWEHPSGLIITGYDRAFVGRSPAIDRRPMDEILNDPSRKPTDFIGVLSSGPPRKSFQSFSVMEGQKVLFQSDESHASHRDPPR